MMDTLTVWYDGNAMSVYPVVAQRFGLKSGYQIKIEAEFWRILRANCEYGLAELRVKPS